jgi:hypothetical protein
MGPRVGFIYGTAEKQKKGTDFKELPTNTV